MATSNRYQIVSLTVDETSHLENNDASSQGSLSGPGRGSTVELLLGLDGMTCVVCVETVERCLKQVPGVQNVTVVLSSNTARVVFDAAQCSSRILVDTVESVGFGAEILDESFAVSVSKGDEKLLLFTLDRIEEAFDRSEFEAAVLRLEGVVSLTMHETEMRIVIDESKRTGPRAIQATCQNYGIQCRLNLMGSFLLSERMLRQQLQETARYKKLFLFSFIFTLPLVIISMAGRQGSEASSSSLEMHVLPGLTSYGLIVFLLASPVQFFSGFRFHVHALSSFRTGEMGMDFMVSSGTFAAYFYSLASLLQGLSSGKPVAEQDLYFETSAVLIAVVLLGRYLESYARGYTASAIHTLTTLRPATAHLLPSDNNNDNDNIAGDEAEKEEAEQLVDASLLQRGDLLRLLAGETVPADGIVTSGRVGVDESMLTGESVAVQRGVGCSSQEVVGGTLVVSGSATMRVQTCGDGSVLGRIVSTVLEAQQSKPKIQETADRVAKRFVPTIAVVSVVTFFAWFGAASAGAVPASWYSERFNHDAARFSFFFALAVWVSACPCAFGLATPTAVLVATGVGAKLGLLIRRGAALQGAAEIRAVAFDKTGTLTEGCMAVTDFRSFSSSSQPGETEILSLVHAMESHSGHPLAKAISDYCAAAAVAMPQRDVEDSEVEVVASSGLRLRQPWGDILVGSLAFVQGEGVAVSTAALRFIEGVCGGGKVAVLVACGGSLALVFGISDRIRVDSAATVAALAQAGIATYMVTGDNVLSAEAIGAAVGIPRTHILAGVRPEGKEAFIAALQQRGVVVAFVGDGTNDSLALARSDVGFALGGGTDLALSTADVVLNKNELSSLITAVELSQATMRRISFNFFWALVYNIVLVPVAAGVLFPSLGFALKPMWAGAAMAASSVSVVCSSLLLFNFRPTFSVSSPMAASMAKPSRLGEDAGADGDGTGQEDSDALLCECTSSSVDTDAIAAATAAARYKSPTQALRRAVASVQMLVRGAAAAASTHGIEVEALLREMEKANVGGDNAPRLLFRQFEPRGAPVSSFSPGGVRRGGCGCGKSNCRCGEACGCGTSN